MKQIFRTPSFILSLILSSMLHSTSASALECEAGFRPFKHDMGEDCIPQQPKRIATTRGDKLATPLLDIGAPLVGSGFLAYQGERYIRGATDIFGKQFVEEKNITSVGNSNEPDIEAMAVLQPDLIMLPGWQTNLYEPMSRIAPTIVIHDNLPFLEHLAIIADAAGMKDVYQDRVLAYQAKIAAIRKQIGHPENISISRFNMFNGTLGYYPNWGAVDQVISDIGFDRPEFQENATKNVLLSLERIQDFDADIILASYAPRFSQTIEFYKNDWDKTAPFWRNLQGVQSGNLYWFERDIWVGYTFKSLDTVADSLLLLTTGRFN